MIENLAPLSPLILEPIVRGALEEDLGRAGDITSDAVVPAGASAVVRIHARRAGYLAGIQAAGHAFHLVDKALKFVPLMQDGAYISEGTAIAEITGPARGILTAERVALNFLGRMSGIATATRQLVDAAGHHKAKIVCTRKTTPGLRSLEKYAVRAGGGVNHRFGLDDAILIKDNHIAIAGGIKAAVARARVQIGHMLKIEVETDTLDQVTEALGAGADAILLDNMAPETLTLAVARIEGRAATEASGNITLETVAAIAQTGVDYISSGAITHSAPNFDVGLDFVRMDS